MSVLLLALALAQETDAGEKAFVPAPLRKMSNVGYGPLRLGAQSPFRIGMGLDVPSSLPAGDWEARETLTWSRMWAQSEEYLLSFETRSRATSVVHGLDDRLQIELGTIATSRFVGDLGGIVRSFHDTFGVRQGGRDTVEDDAYHFQVGDIDLPEARENESPDLLFLSFHSTLADGSNDRPAISASLTFRSGLGDASHTLDVGASLTAAKRWGEFHGYVGVGVARYGQDHFYGLDLRPFGMSVLTAVEWSAVPGASVVLQYLWSLGSVEGYGELSRATSELSLGLKAEYVQGCLFEIGLTENILVFDSSPDLGVHAGVTVRF